MYNQLNLNSENCIVNEIINAFELNKQLISNE